MPSSGSRIEFHGNPHKSDAQWPGCLRRRHGVQGGSHRVHGAPGTVRGRTQDHERHPIDFKRFRPVQRKGERVYNDCNQEEETIPLLVPEVNRSSQPALGEGSGNSLSLHLQGRDVLHPRTAGRVPSHSNPRWAHDTSGRRNFQSTCCGHFVPRPPFFGTPLFGARLHPVSWVVTQQHTTSIVLLQLFAYSSHRAALQLCHQARYPDTCNMLSPVEQILKYTGTA